MKKILLLILITTSCTSQNTKTINCDIYPSSLEQPIPDLIKMKLNGKIKTVIETGEYIAKDRDSTYLKFDKKGFLTKEFIGDVFPIGSEGILYNNKKTLMSDAIIINYEYAIKENLVKSLTMTNTLIEVDSKQNLILERIDKTFYSYNYDLNNKLSTYQVIEHTTDSLVENTTKPVLEIKLIYENQRLKKAIENNLYGDSYSKSTWDYKYDKNKTHITWLQDNSEEATYAYLNCNLQKKTHLEKYKNTEWTYDENGNEISEEIIYEDGDSLLNSWEYDEINNVILQKSSIVANYKYVYQYDKNKNWINKKITLVKNGKIIGESKRIIEYYN